jgi:hypothetical protein
MIKIVCKNREEYIQKIVQPFFEYISHYPDYREYEGMGWEIGLMDKDGNTKSISYELGCETTVTTKNLHVHNYNDFNRFHKNNTIITTNIKFPCIVIYNDILDSAQHEDELIPFKNLFDYISVSNDVSQIDFDIRDAVELSNQFMRNNPHNQNDGELPYIKEFRIKSHRRIDVSKEMIYGYHFLSLQARGLVELGEIIVRDTIEDDDRLIKTTEFEMKLTKRGEEILNYC